MIVVWLFLTCFAATLLPEAKSATVQNNPVVNGVPKIVDPEKLKHSEELRKQAQQEIDAEKAESERLQKEAKEEIEKNKELYEKQLKGLMQQIEEEKMQLENGVKSLTNQVNQEKRDLEEEHKRVLEAQALEKKQQEKQHEEMFKYVESEKENMKKQHEEMIRAFEEERKRLEEEHAQMLADLERDRKEQEQRQKETWEDLEKKIAEDEKMWDEHKAGADNIDQEKYQRLLQKGAQGCKRIKSFRDKKSKYPKFNPDFGTINEGGIEVEPQIQKKYETYECTDDRYGKFYKLKTVISANFESINFQDSAEETLYYKLDWSTLNWEPDMNQPEKAARSEKAARPEKASRPEKAARPEKASRSSHSHRQKGVPRANSNIRR